MTVTPLDTAGNSSKFHVETRHGSFTLTLSFTLRTKIWKLADANAELIAAQELAEAIVSRHNPKFPFKALYILAEHNTLPSLPATLQQFRKDGFKEPKTK